MDEKQVSAQKEPGVFKTIALIVGVLAFLGAAAGVLLFLWKKIVKAMNRFNEETVFEPFDEEFETGDED